MPLSRRAVIDIGTNSVKLLVADVDGHTVIPVLEESIQTRLGQGFYDSHQLRPDVITHTAEVVAQFARAAREVAAPTPRVMATSAARDARNQDELLNAIRKASGLEVDIISGEAEADLVYQGVRSAPALAGQRLMILDVGGGSSEFLIGQGEHPEFARSFALGSVRLLELIRPSDPPEAAELEMCRHHLREFFRAQVMAPVSAALAPGRERTALIGTGGSATILARMQYRLDKYHRHEIEGAVITREAIGEWMKTLWSMPLVERRKIVGLPKKRADVILTGMAIYEAVLELFGFTQLQASTRGLRFAAVMQGPTASARCSTVPPP